VQTSRGSIIVQEQPGAGTTAGEDLFRVTSDDLRAMVEMVERVGARPMLMTYAAEWEPPFRTVNEATRSVSQQLGVPLVDHGVAFRQRNRDALMFADHHPNGQGYGLMVDGILAKFRELGWIAEIPTMPAPLEPRLDQRVELVLGNGNTLRLTAKAGLIFQVDLAREWAAPGDFHRVALAEAMDIPQLHGRLQQDSERVTIPAALLAARPLYALASVLDDEWRLRGQSDVIAVLE
jgi:hypothetical protein